MPNRHTGKFDQLSNWPPEAVIIMKEAGPRGAYRRPEPAVIAK